MFRVAINGLGRIGRATLKIVMDTPELELVAVNELASSDEIAYLLKYDSVYGRFDKRITADNGSLLIGAANFVPTSTGAAAATTKALPQFHGLFNGVAVRAPVLVGSLADVVVVTTRPTTVEEVNGVFAGESRTDRYRDVVGVTDDPFVSADILRDSRASVIGLGLTQVIDGDLVKVMSWYDNEWGYSSQMVREAQRISTGAAGHPRVQSH